MIAASIAELLTWGRGTLAGRVDTPGLDAEILLAHAIGANRGFLRAWPERYPAATETTRYRALTARRAKGCPIAYLTGRREFWSLDLHVTPAVLIPRPETELVVETALAAAPARGPVLDLGTGSGAIALALAAEWPTAPVEAVDRSPSALGIARGNARALRIRNVRWLEGDWFAPVAGRRYRLIVSNPPYIDPGEPEPWRDDAAHEPRTALLTPADGLAAIHHIVARAPAHLEPGGRLILEHGFRQGAPVRRLLTAAGFREIATRHDLQGHERVTAGMLA